MANVFRRESISKIVDTFGLRGLTDQTDQKQSNYNNNNNSNYYNNNNNHDESKDLGLDIQVNNLTNELKHVKLEIEHSRARVQELQETITNVKNDKFKHETNLVSQLQKTQNSLRNDLSSVIKSKLNLCLRTSNEIDRLRTIIKIEHNPEIKRYSDSNSFAASFGGTEDEKENHNKSNNNNSNNNNNNNDNRYNLEYKGYKISRKFPHGDESRIDLIVLKEGDRKTYATPFGGVNLKYTGYIVNNNDASDTNNWIKFTSEEVGNTIYGTKLGKHENIIGLEQAVLSLTTGAKALVWVPYRLAWGPQGAENLIPPCSDIIFELDLMSVENEQQIIAGSRLGGDEIGSQMSGNIGDMSTMATSSIGMNNDDDDGMTMGTIPTTVTDDEHLFASEHYDTHSHSAAAQGGGGGTGGSVGVGGGIREIGPMQSEGSPFTQQYEMTSDNGQDLEVL